MPNSIGELRRGMEMCEGDISSLHQAIRELRSKETEYSFHIRRMERGEPKPGARPKEPDFNPEMMETGLKGIQGNILKHEQQIKRLEEKKFELGIELGRILTGGIQK